MFCTSHSVVFHVFALCRSQVQITDEVRQYLRKPTFDNWQWDDPEMLVLLQQMYIDLGFLSKFNIEVSLSSAAEQKQSIKRRIAL